MMRTVTVKEMLAALPDSPVTQVRGKIKALYDAKTGTSERGDWTMQTGTFSDATGEIRIVFKNRPVMDKKEWIGQPVLIIAHQRQKGGISGLKVNENEYQGKTTKELHITGTAQIEIDDPTNGPGPEGDDDGDDVPMNYPEDDAPAPNADAVAKGKAVAEKQLAEAAAKRTITKPDPTPNDGQDQEQSQNHHPAANGKPVEGAEWKPVMNGMLQMARLLECATRAAHKAVIPHYLEWGIEPDAATLQAMAATIMIEWKFTYGKQVEIPNCPVPSATK